LLIVAASEAASNPLTAALAYVRNNLSQPLTVADMAEQVSLSPSAFAHLFPEVTGRTPYQFLKDVRLDRARDLLVAGHMPVTLVSKEVGYSSASHFIREFRRRFGYTPRAYSDMHSLRDALAEQGAQGSRKQR
jgi:transcriptional regulator GlxA family with amidase domain